MNQENKQSEAKLHALDYWQVIRNRYGVILLAFFLVFMTATVITYMLPNQYLGKVQLQINRTAQEWDVFRETNSGARDVLPYSTYMQTQFEIIESKETLTRVIKKLGLVEEWNLSTEEEAYARLTRKLKAQNVRGTDLIDIEVFHTNAELSAKLANEVALSYRERRHEAEERKAEKALQTLDLQIKHQQDKLEASRVKMLDMMEKYGITDLAGNTPIWMRGEMPETGMKNLVMRSKEDEYIQKRDIDSLRSQIKTLQGLDGDELIEASLSLGIENQTIATQFPTYQQLLIERSSFADSGLGIKHPKVTALSNRIDVTKKMLLDAAENAKKTLGTKLVMAEQNLKSFTTAKEDTVEESMDERRRSIEYVEAKKDYTLAKNMLNNMQEQLAKETVDRKMPYEPIQIHEKATPNFTPAKPNVKLHLILGAAVGLIFGVGLAFFLEYMDTSVKSLEDVERYLEVPVLAVIPKEVGVLHKQSGLSPDAEAYRILRTNIEFNRKSADANAITVVSGGAGEGKSTTLVNLAYICAQGGYNTLMIDGDLRRPRLHTFFDINNSVGLTNYLTTDLMLEDVILQTPVDNLYFMPSGILPADAAGILNSRRMSELIADVKSRFDLVLIDSPPILGVSDASVLASECDLTMIVIQHRKLPRSMLVRVKQAIENVGGTLLGVVLNNVDVRSDNQYQYYTSYYTYYSPTNTESKVKSRISDVSDGEPAKHADSPAESFDDGAKFDDEQY